MGKIKIFGLVCILFVFVFMSSVYAQGISDLIPCKEGQKRACGSDIGICEHGMSECINGKWGPCKGAKKPDPRGEVCGDGLDNDCDGEIDECADMLSSVGIFLIGGGVVLLIFAFVLSRFGY